FAYDRTSGRPLRALMDYFQEAVAKVRINKEKYAEAEARARAMRPQRPPYFDAMGAMGGIISMGVVDSMEESAGGWTGYSPGLGS
ncbi:MAG: hypothetical protein L0271_02145, partial [Gemmatimonadetes bacterium]|nr:hypothetical protein [Gemmatimonadota bacterium]